MDQAITNPISGPSFDFTFTIGPELDKSNPVKAYRRQVILATVLIAFFVGVILGGVLVKLLNCAPDSSASAVRRPNLTAEDILLQYPKL